MGEPHANTPTGAFGGAAPRGAPGGLLLLPREAGLAAMCSSGAGSLLPAPPRAGLAGHARQQLLRGRREAAPPKLGARLQ
eukprot:6877040-Pyramimonas_sp.AAC.1